MQSHPVHRSVVLGMLLLITAAALAGSEQVAGKPLQLEDVVRLHVAGTAAQELIETIRASDVEFELSPEMLEELRRTGLPEPVLEAMIGRQREMAATEPECTRRLQVLLNPGVTKAKQRRIRVDDEVDPLLALDWELGNAPDQRRFVDVAIFLACRSSTHVPDGWRGASPMGVDPRPIARHRILAFAPGAHWSKTGFLRRFGIVPTLGTRYTNRGEQVVGGASLGGVGKGRGALVLEIPPVIEAELECGVEHDLSLGIALQVKDGYYVWRVSELDGVVVDDAPRTLEARITGGSRLDALDVEFNDLEAKKAGGRKRRIRPD